MWTVYLVLTTVHGKVKKSLHVSASLKQVLFSCHSYLLNKSWGFGPGHNSSIGNI